MNRGTPNRQVANITHSGYLTHQLTHLNRTKYISKGAANVIKPPEKCVKAVAPTYVPNFFPASLYSNLKFSHKQPSFFTPAYCFNTFTPLLSMTCTCTFYLFTAFAPRSLSKQPRWYCHLKSLLNHEHHSPLTALYPLWFSTDLRNYQYLLSTMQGVSSIENPYHPGISPTAPQPPRSLPSTAPQAD